MTRAAAVFDAASVSFGRLVFKYRDYLAPAALLAVIAATRPAPFLGSETWDIGLDIVGLFVALCGQSLRVLVIGLAYIQRGGHKKRIAADRLVCEGVFAHCRNPLYVGNFLLVTGLAIVWNSVWVYVLILPAFAWALWSMVRAEEAFLAQKFGSDYEAYCARVNRFVPDLRGFRKTLSSFSFDWKRVVRKEYGTAFAWVSMALTLIAAERILRSGAAAATGTLIGLGVAWLVVFVLWAAARWMKKTRRLESRS